MPPTETAETGIVSSGNSDVLAPVARNATALFLSDAVSKGTLFLWQLILARWLGTEGYGVYGTIGALMIVGASVVELGMGVIVVREVAKRPQVAGRYLAAAFTAQPLLAVVTYAVLQLTAWLLGLSEDLRVLLSLAAISLLINALGNVCHNQLIAAERMAFTAVISVVHVVTLVGLAAAALWMGSGLWGLYVATLAAGTLRAVLYWLALLSIGRAGIGPFDQTVVRALFRDGWPLAVMSFLTLCCMHVDKVLAAALVGTRTAGYLVAAFVISFGVIELLNTPILVALLPLMSRFAEESEEGLYRLIGKLSLLTMALGLPVAVLVSLLATPLCTWFFGHRFLPAADALRIFIWYTCLAMLANVFSQGLIVQNRQRWLMLWRSAGLLSVVAFNLVLLPRLGVVGAAFAAVISEAFVLAVVVGSFRLPAGWWHRIEAGSLRLALATLALAAAVWGLRGIHPLLAGLAGLPIYAVLVHRLGLIGAEERDLIYRLLASIPAGRMVLGRLTRGQQHP